MKLTPRELDHVVLHQVGFLAQKRLARGCRLNYTEAVALVSSVLLELVRDGKSVAELMDLGRTLLGRNQVAPGVAGMVEEIQVEGTFADGTKLLTVHNPIDGDDGDLALALHGSFLPVPPLSLFAPADARTGSSGGAAAHTPQPGAVTAQAGEIVVNRERAYVHVAVTNTGDRPVQVGSHYHFLEANPALCFDRALAYGRRLNILAGTAVRFEPGETKTVQLVCVGGARVLRGGNSVGVPPPAGLNDYAGLASMVKRLMLRGFGHADQLPSGAHGPMGESADACGDEARVRARLQAVVEHACAVDGTRVSRQRYAQMFGPTTGDRLRLGDTALTIAVEADHTVYGDELKFGGGKVVRDGMGQAAGVAAADALDLVITNALIVDYTGIYKADVGVKGDIISAIGKAGNPDIMDSVTAGMVVGVNTEVIAGEGMILTAGCIDTHVHFICPQLVTEALASGITTMIGGGTGPTTGSNATTCTPAPSQMRMMLQATDNLPMNIGLLGKGNSSMPEGLPEIIQAGACGLKIHEDWGATPAAVDACLAVAEQYDIQVAIHTDTLNESGYAEHTIAAFRGRTVHAYHCEGAGGGHAPDIIRVCSLPNVLPSSTTPTRPYTHNTIDEHLDMLMVCHHLSPHVPEDIAFAESRIRGETIAAEDVLHDTGAISIISSDSQAMGRIGEVTSRTWQTAHKMKVQRGQLPEDAAAGRGGDVDNERVKRYIAKYTINPAIAHGVSHLVGSVEVGKIADLCLWSPAFFGVKPNIVLKGGHIACAQMGLANASIPTTQPIIMRPMYAGSPGLAASTCSLAFVSQACHTSGMYKQYGLSKRVVPVVRCRGLQKADMKLNCALPTIEVDPESYRVVADGVHVTCEPMKDLPLAQRYFMF